MRATTSRRRRHRRRFLARSNSHARGTRLLQFGSDYFARRREERGVSRARVSTFPAPRFRGLLPVAPPEPAKREIRRIGTHDIIFGIPQIFGPDRPTDSTEEVQELLERLRSGGDRNLILTRLMGISEPSLRGFFARKGWKPEDCDEMMQETFLRVTKSVVTLRTPKAFFGWIFSIARNVEREKRRQLRKSSLASPMHEIEFEIPDITPSPYDRVVTQELLRLVHSQIQKLPPRRRQIFLLKYFQDRENAEIAAILDCTESTVRVQLYLARKQLGGKGDDE